MNWLVLGLFAAALAVFVAAEWPRLQPHLGVGNHGARRPGRRPRKLHRRRRRSHLVLVEKDNMSEFDEEREAFAESVVRDLERLPTIDDRD